MEEECVFVKTDRQFVFCGTLCETRDLADGILLAIEGDLVGMKDGESFNAEFMVRRMSSDEVNSLPKAD